MCRSPATAGCSRAGRADSIPLHPAERVDLVIDFSATTRPARSSSSTTTTASGGTAPIMRFDVEGGGSEDFRVPRRLRAAGGAPRRQRARPGELALGSGAWQINGSDFDPTGSTSGRAWRQHGDLDVRQQLQPRAPDAHPRLPVPGAGAQRARRSTLADRLGWKDTIGVLPNETVTVLAWFAPYSGKYVFHCHALEHADKAMMLQMEVA